MIPRTPAGWFRLVLMAPAMERSVVRRGSARPAYVMVVSVAAAPTMVTHARGKWIVQAATVRVDPLRGRAVSLRAANRWRILKRPVSARTLLKTNALQYLRWVPCGTSRSDSAAELSVSVARLRRVCRPVPETVLFQTQRFAMGASVMARFATFRHSLGTASRTSRLVITAVEIVSVVLATASSVIQ